MYEQADVARAIKEECESELAVALPILEDALAALDTIKEADITYIRKLGNPPGAIKLVMEVSHLCRLHCWHYLCCSAVLWFLMHDWSFIKRLKFWLRVHPYLPWHDCAFGSHFESALSGEKAH